MSSLNSQPWQQLQPWHKQIFIIKFFRKILRYVLIKTMNKCLNTHEYRQSLFGELKGHLKPSPQGIISDFLNINTTQPYKYIPVPSENIPRESIFITGRFRSGSTLLWNIFRQCPETTSFYEPFNERRWFDPSRRGSKVDKTHLAVDNYWKEYDGLEKLGEYYTNDWTSKRLYMDSTDWDYSMHQYINTIIASTPNKAVLQFNRIDFRLPWIKHHFPNSKILHIFRNPRDQWYSSLKKSNFPTDGTIKDFKKFDHFYLLTWADDLSNYFPFIDVNSKKHPYEIFYIIWKLSYVYGKIYSDYSIKFEALYANPKEELGFIFNEIGIKDMITDKYTKIVRKQVENQWENYASNEWFQEKESICEKIINSYFN